MKESVEQSPSELSQADCYGIYCKWRDNADAFECYVKATCFVSLRHYPDFALRHVAVRRDAIYRKISQYVASELGKDGKGGAKTLFMLDLPAVKSLSASLLLNHDYDLRPVLTLRQLSTRRALLAVKLKSVHFCCLGSVCIVVNPKDLSLCLIPTATWSMTMKYLRQSLTININYRYMICRRSKCCVMADLQSLF